MAEQIGRNGRQTKAEIKKMLDLHRIAHGAVDLNGNVKSFEEQLDAFAYGEMASGDMFVIAASSLAAGLSECPDLPIVMRQSVVNKVTITHELQLKDLKQLNEWLENHPIAMESLTEPSSLVVIADAVDREGRDILIALHLEKDYQQVIVNDIGSIYGKNNLVFLIENTVNAGKEVFVNNRTGDWILRTGVQFPEQIANHLQNLLYQCYKRESPTADKTTLFPHPSQFFTVREMCGSEEVTTYTYNTADSDMPLSVQITHSSAADDYSWQATHYDRDEAPAVFKAGVSATFEDAYTAAATAIAENSNRSAVRINNPHRPGAPTSLGALKPPAPEPAQAQSAPTQHDQMTIQTPKVVR